MVAIPFAVHRVPLALPVLNGPGEFKPRLAVRHAPIDTFNPINPEFSVMRWHHLALALLIMLLLLPASHALAQRGGRGGGRSRGAGSPMGGRGGLGGMQSSRGGPGGMQAGRGRSGGAQHAGGIGGGLSGGPSAGRQGAGRPGGSTAAMGPYGRGGSPSRAGAPGAGPRSRPGAGAPGAGRPGSGLTARPGAEAPGAGGAAAAARTRPGTSTAATTPATTPAATTPTAASSLAHPGAAGAVAANARPGGIGSPAYGAYGAYGADRRYGTYYTSAAALDTQAAAFRAADYRRYDTAALAAYSNAWRPTNVVTSSLYTHPGYGGLARGLGLAAQPVPYDYGGNVVAQSDAMYVNGDAAGTPQEYAAQASQFAAAGQAATPADDAKWLPLGVFAICSGDETSSNDIFQLAVNQQGIIRGNYHNVQTDDMEPISGSVDKTSQRAAWTIGSDQAPVYEAGIANLTKDATPILVHTADGQSTQMTLIRLEEPPADAASGAAPPQP